MGYVHHSRFLQYFEMGRIEMVRASGFSYAALEEQGVFFVVVKAQIDYKAPARYDDELTLTTRIVKTTMVRFDHSYELRKGSELIAQGFTTIACVGKDGKVMEIPAQIRG